MKKAIVLTIIFLSSLTAGAQENTRKTQFNLS